MTTAIKQDIFILIYLMLTQFQKKLSEHIWTFKEKRMTNSLIQDFHQSGLTLMSIKMVKSMLLRVPTCLECSSVMLKLPKVSRFKLMTITWSNNQLNSDQTQYKVHGLLNQQRLPGLCTPPTTMKCLFNLVTADKCQSNLPQSRNKLFITYS